VSLETSIAEALEVKLGDTIDWNIQGVRVRTHVQNLREVDWRRLAVNFFAVFPPGVIEGAPRSIVLLTRHPDADVRAALQRDLVVAFPNVSVIDASLILIAIDAMHREMGLAVRVLALVTLATGFLILVASAASARNERTREVLLLRTLGASSQTVRRVLATESLALGVVAAVIGTAMALVAAWAIVHFVFALPFDPPTTRLMLFALATALASGAIGSANLRRERARSPLTALREAEWRGAGA
jgi:putative ABC transport system permease protein